MNYTAEGAETERFKTVFHDIDGCALVANEEPFTACEMIADYVCNGLPPARARPWMTIASLARAVADDGRLARIGIGDERLAHKIARTIRPRLR